MFSWKKVLRRILGMEAKCQRVVVDWCYRCETTAVPQVVMETAHGGCLDVGGWGWEA